MYPQHIQTIHSEAIRDEHLRRAEQHRLSVSLPRTRQAGVRERLSAMAVAFRRPELVRTPTCPQRSPIA